MLDSLTNKVLVVLFKICVYTIAREKKLEKAKKSNEQLDYSLINKQQQVEALTVKSCFKLLTNVFVNNQACLHHI